MKKTIGCYVAAAMFVLCLFTWNYAQAVSPPKKGDTFPDIAFPVPEDPAHRAYLGLQESGDFKIPQIKAEVVIIEVFNMY
jgi:hypothetical protein